MRMRRKRLMIYLRSCLDLELESKHSASQCSVCFDGLLHDVNVAFKQPAEKLWNISIVMKYPSAEVSNGFKIRLNF